MFCETFYCGEAWNSRSSEETDSFGVHNFSMHLFVGYYILVSWVFSVKWNKCTWALKFLRIWS